MARPIAADASATRSRILGAASMLFGASGAGSVSVRKVASEAGVSLATVHHYFGSKAQLYQACLGAMYQELEALRLEMFAAFATAEADADYLEIGVRRAFRFAVQHRDTIRLLMRTIIDTGEMNPTRRSQVHLPFLEEAAALLATRYQFAVEPPRLVVQSIMHLIVRYALTAPDELAMVAGLRRRTKPETARQAIEEHLVKLTYAVAGAPTTTTEKE